MPFSPVVSACSSAASRASARIPSSVPGPPPGGTPGSPGGRGRGDLLHRLIVRRAPLYALSLAFCLLAWHAAAAALRSPLLPGPADVFDQLLRLSGRTMIGKTLWGHLGASLGRVLAGWSLSVAPAVPLGIVMALNPYVNAVVKPIFDLLKPIPAIAWISISILWFGLGEESKIFIIAIGSFVPCLLNTYNGVRLIDPALYDVARMLGASRRQQSLEVDVFACLPAIFAGLRISFSFAWSCVLAAEMVGSRSGLGFLIILGMNQSRPAMIIGGMLVIALTAWLFDHALTLVQRRICPWMREVE